MKIGIISDIHEDSIRLSKAILELEKSNCDLMICLGDIAGFDRRFYSYELNRNLRYCIEIIKTNCKYAIIGNHDLFAIKKNPSYNHVFEYPYNWYNLPLNERKLLSNGVIWNFEYDLPVELSIEGIDYLDSLPEFAVVEELGIRILFSHSLFPDPSGMSIMKHSKYKDFALHFNKLLDFNCNLGVSGHYHPNGVLKINTRVGNSKFGTQKLGESLTQYICPCIADGTQDNGYTIIDTKQKTIEAIPLRFPKNQIFW